MPSYLLILNATFIAQKCCLTIRQGSTKFLQNPTSDAHFLMMETDLNKFLKWAKHSLNMR